MSDNTKMYRIYVASQDPVVMKAVKHNAPGFINLDFDIDNEDFKYMGIKKNIIPNQPFGYDETFACAYRKCLWGVHIVKNMRYSGGNWLVVSIVNGICVNNDRICDFCACVIAECNKDGIFFYSSYDNKDDIKMTPVDELVIADLFDNSTQCQTIIDGQNYVTGFMFNDKWDLAEKYSEDDRIGQLTLPLNHAFICCFLDDEGTTMDEILAKIPKNNVTYCS
jgi:hypothetical protein